MFKDDDAELEMTLIATFLLCCFEVVANRRLFQSLPDREAHSFLGWKYGRGTSHGH